MVGWGGSVRGCPGSSYRATPQVSCAVRWLMLSMHVQINIPQDLVTYILDNLSQGLITRGLFHEAALNIFSVLILFWKRFCVHRFAPRERRHSTMTRGRAGSSLYHPEERRQSHIPHTHLFWGKPHPPNPKPHPTQCVLSCHVMSTCPQMGGRPCRST